ncbi:MAG: diguanylate cyclase [Nitrospirota bacterium]
MTKQAPIATIPLHSRFPAVPRNTLARISITTDRFPTWMSDRPIRWIVITAAIITVVTLLCLGWTAYTVQRGLIESSGRRLVQAASDAAGKLDMLILERYRDIQMLSSAPMAQGQNPEALTTYLQELARTHPAYRWIGVTDSHGKIVAATDSSSRSQDQSQRLWFQLARTLAAARVLNTQESEKFEGTTTITVLAPLRSPDGQFVGAIAAIVGLPTLMNILDKTIQGLKKSEGIETSPIEYHVIDEKGDLIADSTRWEDDSLKQLGLPSSALVGLPREGYIEETHLRREVSIVTAYAQVPIAHTEPAQHWGILIQVDRNGILAPMRTFLRELSILAVLILLPLVLLVLGMIKTLHTEWNSTKREFRRATDAEAALKKRTEALHALIDAAQKLAAQQDLDELLRQLLLLAKKSTGARYATLELYHGSTRAAIQFLTHGVDETAAHALRRLPFGQVSREALGQGDAVLRQAHLTAYWAALGLPMDDALTTSFLGVSIRCHDQFFGHLSLANKATPQGLAEDFSDLDEQIVLTLASQVGTAIQNLQLLHDSREQANYDSLTGLLNHSTTLMMLTQELSRAERSHQPLGVLIADLDHFKRVNDTYGHPVGDLVLREAARRLRNTARRYDHVGRIGGEEFLMVVPNCDLNVLRECAERFRSCISDLPFTTPSGPLDITVSIGATIWSSEHPLSSELLHKMADYALYRVKNKGRNGIDIIPHPHSVVAEQMKKAG